MKSSIIPLLFCSFISLITILILLSKTKPYSISLSSSPQNPSSQIHPRLKIYVTDLPRSFNYGLLDEYWSLSAPDSRINADPDAELRLSLTAPRRRRGPLPYPENPLIKQYSAEYWLFGDLETPARSRAVSSLVERVYDWRNADVVFVPFFATLSAEMELGWGRKGGFRKKEGNGDYRRQREVVDRIRSSDAWKRSGGRDHVFVLTGICLFPIARLI